mgnify:FL=1
MIPEPTPEQIRHLAEHELSQLCATAMTDSDECIEHGENCPIEGCATYCETLHFATAEQAREAGRFAFILGNVYEVDGANITFWPHADRVPVRAAIRLTANQRAEIMAAAKATAALFVDEFGEALDPSATDWDSTAWETDSSDLSFRDEIENCWGEAWSLYQNALVIETQRLVEVAS